MATQTQLQRLEKDMKRYAKEVGTFEVINNTAYFFTSELGALRLFQTHNSAKRLETTHFGYSENLSSHYFSIDLP